MLFVGGASIVICFFQIVVFWIYCFPNVLLLILFLFIFLIFNLSIFYFYFFISISFFIFICYFLFLFYVLLLLHVFFIVLLGPNLEFKFGWLMWFIPWPEFGVQVWLVDVVYSLARIWSSSLVGWCVYFSWTSTPSSEHSKPDIPGFHLARFVCQSIKNCVFDYNTAPMQQCYIGHHVSTIVQQPSVSFSVNCVSGGGYPKNIPGQKGLSFLEPVLVDPNKSFWDKTMTQHGPIETRKWPNTTPNIL